jgi:nicotinamidase-related amidase
VEETAREAFHHRYETQVLEDGVSPFADEPEGATLRNFTMKFGWVQNMKVLIAGMSQLK